MSQQQQWTLSFNGNKLDSDLMIEELVEELGQDKERVRKLVLSDDVKERIWTLLVDQVFNQVRDEIAQ